AGEHILHRPEIGRVDLDRAQTVAGLAFGHAHPGQRRVAEHGAGDAIVIDPRRLVAEDAVGEGVRFANGDRRPLDPVGDIADRIDARYAAAAVRVDLDFPVLAQIDSRRCVAESLRIGCAPGGEQYRVRLDIVAAVHLGEQYAVVAPDNAPEN